MGYTGQDLGLSYTFTKATKTIVFFGYTINSLKDISVITDVTNGVIIYNFADANTGVFTVATQTLVLTYNTNTVAFADADELVINLFGAVATDPGLDISKTIDQSPLWSRRTDVEALIASAYTLTVAYVNVGPAIANQGYKYITFYIKCTVQNSLGIKVKFNVQHTYGGSEVYTMPLDTITAGVDTITIQAFGFPDAVNFLYPITIPVNNTIAYIQPQFIAGTVGVTAGTIDTFYCMKGY